MCPIAADVLQVKGPVPSRGSGRPPHLRTQSQERGQRNCLVGSGWSRRGWVAAAFFFFFFFFFFLGSRLRDHFVTDQIKIGLDRRRLVYEKWFGDSFGFVDV